MRPPSDLPPVRGRSDLPVDVFVQLTLAGHFDQVDWSFQYDVITPLGCYHVGAEEDPFITERRFSLK
jgi:hypothetical protein